MLIKALMHDFRISAPVESHLIMYRASATGFHFPLYLFCRTCPKKKTARSPGCTLLPFCLHEHIRAERKTKALIAGELRWWWWWIIPHFHAFSEQRPRDRWGSSRPLTSPLLTGISIEAPRPSLGATGLLLQLNPADISMGSIPAQALLSKKMINHWVVACQWCRC